MGAIILLALAAGGWYYAKNHKLPLIGADEVPLNPQRRRHVEVALRRLHDPVKLAKTADLFDGAGHKQAAKALRFKSDQVKKQARVAKELCDQARAGDQNATGTIMMIADRALKGSPRAQVSAHLIDVYTRRNPPPPVEVRDTELERVAAAHGNFAPGEPPPQEGMPSETPLTLQYEDGGSVHGEDNFGTEDFGGDEYGADANPELEG